MILFSCWKSINIPINSAHADDMEEVIHSAGLQMPRETWCRNGKRNTTNIYHNQNSPNQRPRKSRCM